MFSTPWLPKERRSLPRLPMVTVMPRRMAGMSFSLDTSITCLYSPFERVVSATANAAVSSMSNAPLDAVVAYHFLVFVFGSIFLAKLKFAFIAVWFK